MKTAMGLSPAWAQGSAWPLARKTPFVIVLAGIGGSDIVNALLADSALTEAVIPRFEPSCTPPCDALLWRLETASGESLNTAGLIARHWHRAPYAMTVRLAQYQPGSVVPEYLDEGTIGTRRSRSEFIAALDRLAMRFVRDAALGRGRGLSGTAPVSAPHGLPGWFRARLSKWHDRLTTEWWSIASSSASIDFVMSGAGLGRLKWYHVETGRQYLADPFPWPGTNRILCEEMPLTNGVGRIVATSVEDGMLTPPTVVLDDGVHHSYPCAFQDEETVYCVPESPERGTTRIYRLQQGGSLVPICDVAPHARLADPTIFQWKGRYWLGCTDLDLGTHDNFCLLHATTLNGPWTPHLRWPVKIDVRGARPAGMMFRVGEKLLRPAQDCASTYGAGIVINHVTGLNETEFHESPVLELRPDKSGPFPHGLHTLVHDGEKFWVDGKRFVVDLGLFRKKFESRAARVFTRAGVG